MIAKFIQINIHSNFYYPIEMYDFFTDTRVLRNFFLNIRRDWIDCPFLYLMVYSGFKFHNGPIGSRQRTSRQSLGDASTGWSGEGQDDGVAVGPATDCAEDRPLAADRRTTRSTLALWSKDDSTVGWSWWSSGRPEAAEETRCARSRTSYPRCCCSLHPRFHSPLLSFLRPGSYRAPGTKRRSLTLDTLSGKFLASSRAY